MRLALLPLLLFAACPRPPVDRYGLTTDTGKACATLRALACPEGSEANGATCFEHFTRRSDLVEVPAACWKDAKTVEAVRACGGPNTLRIRCQP